MNVSSRFEPENYKPEYITDGLVDGRIVHTMDDPASWIRVYLLVLYDVTAIKVCNRPLTNVGKLIFLSAIV